MGANFYELFIKALLNPYNELANLVLMNSEIKANNDILSNAAARRTRLDPRLRRTTFSIFAAFGIFGGISALFVGLVFVVLYGIVPGDRMFDSVGTGLLIVAIPMILIGSIFLDSIEKKDG